MGGYREIIAAFMLISTPLVVFAESVKVPSGQPITFHEVIWEAEGKVNTYRFRYIAPEIDRKGGSIGFDQAEQDLSYLCQTSALPALIAQGRAVDRIVISLSDRVVEFGKSNPDATQFFEAYKPNGAKCDWEGG